MKANLILQAARYADHAHRGQVRKYTGKPYITHPGRVAAKATIYFANAGDLDKIAEIVAAAWMHDVAEDTEYTFDMMLEYGFPVGTVNLCRELTNPSKGVSAPRQVRKQMDRDHLKDVSHEAKILKMLDRLDNIMEMAPEAPLDFIQMYAEETKLLIDVLRPADLTLADEVMYEVLRTKRIAESWQKGQI